jgi:chromosome segregation ATPase
MPKQTKSEQIDMLQTELKEAQAIIRTKTNRIDELHSQADDFMGIISDLNAEIAKLIHTPEFAADTESAFDRGRQDGVRSLVYSAQGKLVDMQKEIEVLVQSLVRKYSRDMSWDLFHGGYPSSEEVKLPDTDFTRKLLDNAEKL